MEDLEKLEAQADSIDETYMGIYMPVEDDNTADQLVAALHRESGGATDRQWQYVVSLLFHVTNDQTQAANRVRAKARADVRLYVGDAT
jgi:putative IMPACT (imprinted ancient) family translation regulator